MADAATINDLLDRWEELMELGVTPSVEELCSDRPDLLDEVRERVALLHRSQLRLGADPSPPRQLACTLEFDDIELFNDEGALGLVYKALDRRHGRHVAIKIIRGNVFSTCGVEGTEVERFQQEARVTSNLDHPGIVSVLGTGTAPDGRPFYVMQLVRGQSLAKAIETYHSGSQSSNGHSAGRERGSNRRRRLRLRELLNHFVATCDAIAYAHHKGVIHRDIKPGNIMLGRYGETFVLDWGLAAPFDPKDGSGGQISEATRRIDDLKVNNSGGSGTLAYMSPERLRNTQTKPTPADDIYSLGATLYRLLTGKPPIEDNLPIGEMCTRIVAGKISPPSQVNRSVPRAMEAICRKAMNPAPADRYQTAKQLAEDVRRYLANERVDAYREPLREWGARLAFRNSAATLIAVSALLALLTVSVATVIMLGRAVQNEQSAKEQALRLAANYAAQTVGQEIDNLWRILEAAASDPELTKKLASLPERLGESAPIDKVISDPFQSWLSFVEQENRPSIKAESWFLCDRLGWQLACIRDGGKPDSIGKNFALRDYFHGRGRDLGEGRGAYPAAEVIEHKLTPLTTTHLSTVYRSSTDGDLKVSLSVPVKNQSGTVVGVLGMSIKLGHFEILQRGLGANQVVVLANLECDTLESDPKPGLILHHRELSRLYETGTHFTAMGTPRLSETLIASLASLRRDHLKAIGSNRPRLGLACANYQDPVEHHFGNGAKDWSAICVPIFVNGRQKETPRWDTGWVVVVQEHASN